MALAWAGVVVLWVAVAAAAPNRVVFDANAAFDLNSLATGPNGELWLASGHSLYRFDGLHYHRVESFPLASALHVVRASDNSMWIAGEQGLVRYEQGRFETKLPGFFQSLVAGDGELFARRAGELLRIGLDGSAEATRPIGFPNLTVDDQGRLWYTDSQWIYRLDRGAREAVKAARATSGFSLPATRALAGRGGLWLSDSKHAVYLGPLPSPAPLRRTGTLFGAEASALLPGRNGQIWFMGNNAVEGLYPPVRFAVPAPPREPSMVLYEADDGQVWFRVPKQGLARGVPDPHWETWPASNWGGVSAGAIVREQDGGILLATHGGFLYRLDRSSRTWRRLPQSPAAEYFGILPLAAGEGLLAATHNLGLLHLSSEGAIRQRIPYPNPAEKSDSKHRDIFRDAQGGIWVANKTALLALDGTPGAFHLRRVRLPAEPRFAETADVELDRRGRLWVGYTRGLAWLDIGAGAWRPIETDKRAVDIRSFSFRDNEREIWVAYRGKGRFSRLTAPSAGDGPWKVADFTLEAGYPAQSTYFLKTDSRGWIWRGTNEGVFVSDGRHIAPNDWLHLTRRTGLAGDTADQFGFLEDADGTVWLSTEEGVTHLRPDPAWFALPAQAALRLTRLHAGQKTYLDIDGIPSALPTGTRDVELDLGSMQVSPWRDVPFLYRLPDRSPTWRPAPQGRIRLQDLADGAWRIEAAFAAPNPAPALTIALHIGAPAAAPTRTWWLLLAALAAAAGVAARQSRHALPLLRLRYQWARLRHRLGGQPAGGSAPDADPLGDAEEQTALAPGDLVAGRYRIVRPLSRGGFASVFEAEDAQHSQAPVAVKVFSRRVSEQPWVRDRFAHEIAALQLISHPGVLPLVDSWIGEDGRPYVVAPFVPGQTLRAALAAGPLPPDRAAHLIRGIGEALGAIHRSRVVHRDLKPENILLRPLSPGCEQPVVIDFGNASLFDASQPLANTLVLMGSPYYMAPEQLTQHYSPASDIYSLAVIAVEMLTGQNPSEFSHGAHERGFAAELAALLQSQGVNGDPLIKLLAMALLPDPSARPVDAQNWAAGVAEAIVPAAAGR